jgi:hypothetical protein
VARDFTAPPIVKALLAIAADRCRAEHATIADPLPCFKPDWTI